MASISTTIRVQTGPTARPAPSLPHTHLIPSVPLSSLSPQKPKRARPAPLFSTFRRTRRAKNLSPPLVNRTEKVAAQGRHQVASGFGWNGPGTDLWLSLVEMTAEALKLGRGGKMLHGG